MLKMLLPITLALATSLAAAPLKIKDSSVSFEATGNPGFLTIPGIGGKLTAKKLESDGAYIWGEFEVQLKDFDTGMALRNDHMLNKYLLVEQYPVATLSLEKTPVSAKKFKGKLTIKTDTKAVGGSFEKKGSSVKASFVVNIDDFPSIGKPNWKGIGLEGDVKIEVSATVSN